MIGRAIVTIMAWQIERRMLALKLRIVGARPARWYEGNASRRKRFEAELRGDDPDEGMEQTIRARRHGDNQ